MVEMTEPGLNKALAVNATVGCWTALIPGEDGYSTPFNSTIFWIH